ncbi:MAG: tripartite tricarboxylate transporter TctB family protein [Oscillospiraceae bacterium]|nr:tripartite tricarboxylate transporter TctB family protein [Oscillospiraceae bacterium]
MKMKKTDIGVIVFMYLVCAYFYTQTIKFQADSQTYPMFTIALLFGLTTLYLLQMIVAAKKHGVESGVDTVFKDLQPKQLLVCLLGAIVYVVLMYFFGFYISTVIFMAAVLLYLRVPLLHSAIAIVAILALVYFAFGKFLGVRLPVGTVIKMLR